MFVEGPLGRRVPRDFEHVSRFPFSAAAPATVAHVEKVLKLPYWHWTHDQGAEGSCVGHGAAIERAITNTSQNILLKAVGVKTRRYSALHLWNEAKKIDEWDDTNPGDDNGTSVRAAYDVLRDQGARRVKKAQFIEGQGVVESGVGEVDLTAGVSTNRWAVNVDEIRTGISIGLPVTIGVRWYSVFDRPVQLGPRKESWVAVQNSWGQLRGGHCVTIYGASDKRSAFRVKNSWGRDYPLVWLPYVAMQRLLDEDGEACLVVDR